LPEEWLARNSKAAYLVGPTEFSWSENWKLLFTHTPIHRFTWFFLFAASRCRFWLPLLVAVLRPLIFSMSKFDLSQPAIA